MNIDIENILNNINELKTLYLSHCESFTPFYEQQAFLELEDKKLLLWTLNEGNEYIILINNKIICYFYEDLEHDCGTIFDKIYKIMKIIFGDKFYKTNYFPSMYDCGDSKRIFKFNELDKNLKDNIIRTKNGFEVITQQKMIALLNNNYFYSNNEDAIDDFLTVNWGWEHHEK